MEYINHLAFILGPHMGTLPQATGTKITSLPREAGVDIKPGDLHTPKLVPMVDSSTLAADDIVTLTKRTGLGEFDVGELSNLIARYASMPCVKITLNMFCCFPTNLYWSSRFCPCIDIIFLILVNVWRLFVSMFMYALQIYVKPECLLAMSCYMSS